MMLEFSVNAKPDAVDQFPSGLEILLLHFAKPTKMSWTQISAPNSQQERIKITDA